MICAYPRAVRTLTWSFSPFQQVKGTSPSTPLSRYVPRLGTAAAAAVYSAVRAYYFVTAVRAGCQQRVRSKELLCLLNQLLCAFCARWYTAAAAAVVTINGSSHLLCTFRPVGLKDSAFSIASFLAMFFRRRRTMSGTS